VTNPRRVATVHSGAEAIQVIAELLSFLHVLPIPARAVEWWLDMLRSRPVTGGAVFDLQIASSMVANGVNRIYTFNIDDFKHFAEIEALTPD
jgi:predicted nucleic acid-binding protein